MMSVTENSKLHLRKSLLAQFVNSFRPENKLYIILVVIWPVDLDQRP